MIEFTIPGHPPLEPRGNLTHPGIVVISETEEEKIMLLSLWCNRGRMAAIDRPGEGPIEHRMVELTFAPTPAEVKA